LVFGMSTPEKFLQLSLFEGMFCLPHLAGVLHGYLVGQWRVGVLTQRNLNCAMIFLNHFFKVCQCGDNMTRTLITRENIELELSKCGPDSRIYLGCDSRRFRESGVFFADYTLVVVIHDDGCKGAKILGQTVRERVFDNTPDRPALRLLNEVYKLAAMFQEYEDLFVGFHTEVHLDLNPNKRFKSSGVVSEAIGYIRGVCQIEAKLKPHAWAASFAADRFESLVAA